MKNKWFFFLGILFCLLVVVGSYLTAIGMMDSIYAYRSPIHATPPEPGNSVGKALTERLVFVLIDALRLDTAYDPTVMPFLNELREQSAWAEMNSRQPSYSAPSYSVIFTGAWPELSDGPVFNLEMEDLQPWTQDNLFSAAQRGGLNTAVSGFEWFSKLIPEETVTEGYYTAGEDQVADRAVVDAALPWLRSDEFDLILIHLDQVDYAGHYEGGVRDPNWNAASGRVDALLVEIAAELDLQRDTLFISSDHGQVALGGHGGGEPEVLREPFVLVGAGVVAGEYGNVQMVDIAPTLAVLLGLNLPASAQGLARSEMLTLSAESLTTLEIAQSIQQKRLAEIYQAAIGHTGDVPEDVNMVAAASESMQVARQVRIDADRLPRFTLASGLALIPLVLLVWKRSSQVVRLLGGALLFQVVYQIRYALLLGKGFSFSYVAGPVELVIDGLVNTLLAFGVAWLVCCLGSIVLNQDPRRAAEETLKLAMVTLILPFLVVLWSYAMDGLWVGWALPDFGRSFMALFALVQALAIGVWGLIFAGTSAGVVGLVRRK